jgi:uncharacterized membrane protein YeaQ/YmgE (transglycosylase-associated protein family)
MARKRKTRSASTAQLVMRSTPLSRTSQLEDKGGWIASIFWGSISSIVVLFILFFLMPAESLPIASFAPIGVCGIAGAIYGLLGALIGKTITNLFSKAMSQRGWAICGIIGSVLGAILSWDYFLITLRH